MITDAGQLASLIEQIESADRVAVDTEADSLHSYREKLCLLQISVPAVADSVDAGKEQRDSGMDRDHRARLRPSDFIVDPLGSVVLEPLRRALEGKEIVLHGADYDLRMLRRGLNLVASRIFDTLIAARLLGIREFSLAALVKHYFGLTLLKGSQKANWAQRPLPARMAEYAINDVHYLLALAQKLEAELDRCERRDWLRQSCQRAVELAAVARTRNQDELWRIRGSGILRGRAAAVLRALWQWREKEAEEWPVSRRRSGTRPTTETIQRAEELRRRRDKSAEELGLEPSFIAPRSTLEAIAADGTRVSALLVPWQRELLGVSVLGSEESTDVCSGPLRRSYRAKNEI